MLEKNISIFIEKQFPDNFRNDGELLVKFMEYYYQWLEEEGNVTDVTRRITDYSDPDKIPEEFFDFLRYEFMNSIPANLRVDQKLLLKNILNFYKAKGTESSYRLLFRILFNVEINFYYPGDDILRASDGRWTIERYLRVSEIPEDTDLALITEVWGQTSKARARVERIERFLEMGIIDTRLYVTNVSGNFIIGESILRIENSEILCSTVSELITDNGKWIGTYGQLSSNKRLQDNFYYQEFSYEIQSPVDTLKYRKIVEDLVHPAGTKLFGKVLSEYEISPILAGLDIDGNAYLVIRDGVLLLDNTTLDLIEDRLIDFSYILDFNVTTTQGGGLVSVNDGQISDFGSSFSIGDFGLTPISLIGTRKLIAGTGTSFTSEIAQPLGEIFTVPATIQVADTDNSYLDGSETVAYSYSDRFLSLVDDYPYAATTLEAYTITRSAPPNNIETENYISNTAFNVGTITVSNLIVTGSNTAFTSDVTPGDIIMVADPVNANTYAFVYSVDSNTQLTLNENYKWTSANTSQYKVFSY